MSALKRLVIVILLSQTLFVQASNASYSDWKEGVELSNKQLSSVNDDSAVIEQSINLPVSQDEVFNILADIKNYTVLYPLFDEVDIHKTYQTNTLRLVSEFTALDRQQLGPYAFEDLYFSAIEVNSLDHKINLKIWQPNYAFINIQISVKEVEAGSIVKVKTQIQAPKDKLNTLMVNEFRAPTLRLDFLKILLEGGDVSFYSECMLKPKMNHVCF